MAFSWLLVALAPSAPQQAVLYRCLDNTMFTLSASPTLAIVRFADAEYRLPRRPSSLTVKYGSNAATLFLDGNFAAFVAEDRPLPGCSKVKPGPRR